MRKYTFLLLFLIAPVILIFGIDTFVGTFNDLKEFPVVTGEIKSFEVLDKSSLINFGKFATHINFDLYCVTLTGFPTPIIVGKKDYSLLQSSINPAEIVTIYLDDTSRYNESLPASIQIEKGKRIIDAKTSWAMRERLLDLLPCGLGIYMFVLGIKMFTKFRQERRENAEFQKRYNMYNH